MIQFLTKRIAYGLLVLLGVVFIIFFLFNVLPVNSARMTMGQRADVATIEAVEQELGLNLPFEQRLWKYITEVSPIAIHEDSPQAQEKFGYTKLFSIADDQAFVLKPPYLGTSYQTGKTVNSILIKSIPQTAILALSAILLAVIIGIPLGIVAALNHNKAIDNIAVTTSVIGISQPSYFISILLSVYLGHVWYEYTGLNHQGSLFVTGFDGTEIVWKNLILPTIALGVRPIAIITQLTRSTMLDVMSQDYIRTAKAKGLSHRIVIWKHALRNAMNPVVTSVSGWFASLLAGAFFVEFIFNFKGLGNETITALQSFDLPVVMGAVLFTAVIFVIVNIFVDIIYAFLDPRVSVKAH